MVTANVQTSQRVHGFEHRRGIHPDMATANPEPAIRCARTLR